MKKKAVVNDTPVCQIRMQAISDTMSILSGKWKFHILGTLIEGEKLGFMDLMREIDGIGSKMLSKELQDLEMNHLVSRTVMDTKPITVEYAITEYGATLAIDNRFMDKIKLGVRIAETQIISCNT